MILQEIEVLFPTVEFYPFLALFGNVGGFTFLYLDRCLMALGEISGLSGLCSGQLLLEGGLLHFQSFLLLSINTSGRLHSSLLRRRFGTSCVFSCLPGMVYFCEPVKSQQFTKILFKSNSIFLLVCNYCICPIVARYSFI